MIMTIIKLQFKIKNQRVAQLIPGKAQSDIGQRKGVGRTSLVWVGISIKI